MNHKWGWQEAIRLGWVGPGQGGELGWRSSQCWDHLERSPGHHLQSQISGSPAVSKGCSFLEASTGGGPFSTDITTHWGCELCPCPPRTGSPAFWAPALLVGELHFRP